MPKMKTRQAVAKRFTVTKNKKILKRKGGQDHYNARETGKVGRNKKQDDQIGKADQRNIRRFLPYA